MIYGKIYKKPWFLPSNIVVSCKFSHHPILWLYHILWMVKQSCTTKRMIETPTKSWDVYHLSNKIYIYIPWILLKITIRVYKYVIIYIYQYLFLLLQKGKPNKNHRGHPIPCWRNSIKIRTWSALWTWLMSGILYVSIRCISIV